MQWADLVSQLDALTNTGSLSVKPRYAARE